MQNPLILSPKMEVHSQILQTTLPTYLTSSNLVQKRCLYGQFTKFCSPKKYPGVRKLQLVDIKSQQSSGAARFSSLKVKATSENVSLKDEDVVFVAGATGKVGSRTLKAFIRELLKLGCRVRAGVRSVQRAESLLQSVRQMKLDTEATSGPQPIEKLEIVECDLEQSDRIIPALGSASVVICCIGASEKEVFDVTGPYRIDYEATKNLIGAATVAKVNHFILLTSLGTNKVGFPAAILNLFWGVLIWKRKAEEVLIESGLPYTIVRPGGMERPTDSYKETHNITLSQEDTLFGGQVSNLQVAELLAFMAQNRDLSYCKVVEVIAETTAPLTPLGELLVKIPSKRDDLNKAETLQAAGKPEPSLPKSMITEAAVISKEKDPSEEKLLELDAATQPLASDPAESSVSEVPSPTMLTGKETVEDTIMVPRPLSPYTAYEDLKPPSSPSPSPPSDQGKKIPTADAAISTADAAPTTSYTPSAVLGTDAGTSESATAGTKKLQPLSPYTAYEDLKPPSSPSPSAPNSSSKEPSETSKTVDGEGVPEVIDGLPEAVDGVPEVIDGTMLEKVPQELIFYHSPYSVYDDLKPPTSPTPTAPTSLSISVIDTESEMATTSNNDAVEPVTEEKAEDKQNPSEEKLRPLSPYTMYDDMKPPTSPMPSSPKGH